MGLLKVEKVKFNINAFRSDEEIELAFPRGWDVTECLMAGHDMPALSDEAMTSAMHNPLGAPRLSELARGKSRVCILFDDIAKPTPVRRMVPFVLAELHAGSIRDDQIRFVCAPGTHRPLLYPELVAKLGRDVVEKYPVYNHSIWENLVDMGRTGRGTPVQVNREYASCDLRIGLSGIVPHGNAGFGGGGKIILPGVSGIETIDFHHANMRIKNERGRVDDNVFRLDIEEAARLAGLHYKIDCVINNHREIIGLFAGEQVAVHRAGARLGARVYRTETVRDMDVVVANSYPNEVQLLRVMWCIGASLREGGDMVIWSHAPDGQMLHQLNDRFGTDYGGRRYDPAKLHHPQAKAHRIIFVAPFLTRCEKDSIAPPEKLIHCRDWAEALVALLDKNGPGTRVGVYPYAPLQLTEKAAEWLA